ncbi:MAG: ABC transporter ATP-binding protein [Methylocystaceae bacterium]
MVELIPSADIELQEIGMTFYSSPDNSIQALNNINLKIDPGEFICLIGPSGCGKSTLLRLIAGLDVPTTGKIFIDDQPVKGPHYSRGFVFQDPTLFPWRNIRANVAVGLEARGVLKQRNDEVDEYLKLVGLKEFGNLYPHQLSGGMAQRVALARSLVNHPRVLLMDEPLGALDAFTRMHMQDEILRIWEERKTTMVFVTHDIDEAIYLGDRVVIMTPGPGEIKKVLDISLGRPRSRGSSDFYYYRTLILETFNLNLHLDPGYLI